MKETTGIMGDEKDINFYQIFTQSPAIWLVIDPETGRIIDANAAATNFYGYSIGELRALTIFEINIASTMRITELMNSVKNSSEKPIIFQHKLKNGFIKDVQVYSSPFLFNTRILLSSIIIDITESKKDKEELQRSRDRLNVVVEATKAGIWDWDIKTRKIFFDKRFRDMLGYEEAETISVWEALCYPDDIPRVTQAAQDYLTGGNDRFEVECRLLHKDGSYRWIRATGQLLYDREGLPLKWVGSCSDIHHRKIIENLQQEHGRKMRHFAYAISDLSFIMDEDGRYIEAYVNSNVFPFFSKRNLQGKTLYDILPHEEACHYLEDIRETIETQKPLRIKRTINRRIGKRTLIIRTALMDYTLEGKRTVAVAILDITEQEKAMALLQSSYELRMRNDILNDILNMKPMDKEITAYVKNLGVDFSLPLFCCILKLDTADDVEVSPNNIGIQGLRDEIIIYINSLHRCLAWNYRDTIAIVSQADKSNLRCNMDLAESLHTKISGLYPELIIKIGVGETRLGQKGFVKSFQQAWDAYTASRCMGNNKVVIHFRDLGVLKILLGQNLYERTPEYIENMIGNLIRYDAEKGTNYLDTLEVILQNENLKEAAQTLFIHHNTAIFRKKRIEEILDIPINNFEIKLCLAMAIKLHRLNKEKAL